MDDNQLQQSPEEQVSAGPQPSSKPLEDVEQQPQQTQQSSSQAQQSGVVYTNEPESGVATGVPIPEEYLTDEDLYPPPTTDTKASYFTSLSRKKKPLLFIAIGGVLVLIIFISLLVKAFSGTSKNQELKLLYWGLWEKENVMQELINAYTKTHPNVEIEYVLMDAKDNYRERLIERTKKGTGPDIFRFHNTWVPQIKEILSTAPETVFTEDEFQKIFYPVVNKDLVINGSIVGVPLGIDGLVLIYNDAILKAAGVSSPPESWDELLEAAQKVTVKDSQGNIITAGIALGAAENVSHYSDILALMFLQNGIDFTNFKDDEAAISVLDTYTNFVLSANNLWDELMENSITAFANEKVAFIFAPTWQVEVIKHLNPDLPLKTAPVPQIRGGMKKNIASYWVEGVSRGSKYQKEAWEFLKFLIQKENLSKLYDLQVKSGRIFGYSYPRVDMSELLIQHEYLGAIIKDSQILDSFPLISFTYDNGLNDRLSEYLKDAINSVLVNKSSRDALNTMQNGFKQVYSEYQFEPKLSNP